MLFCTSFLKNWSRGSRLLCLPDRFRQLPVFSHTWILNVLVIQSFCLLTHTPQSKQPPCTDSRILFVTAAYFHCPQLISYTSCGSISSIPFFAMVCSILCALASRFVRASAMFALLGTHPETSISWYLKQSLILWTV